MFAHGPAADVSTPARDPDGLSVRNLCQDPSIDGRRRSPLRSLPPTLQSLRSSACTCGGPATPAP